MNALGAGMLGLGGLLALFKRRKNRSQKINHSVKNLFGS